MKLNHFSFFLTPCICKTGAVFLTMISQELGKAFNWLTLIISSIQTEMGNDIFGISSLPLKFTIFISLPFELNIGGSSFDFFCLLDPNYRRKCLRDNNQKDDNFMITCSDRANWMAGLVRHSHILGYKGLEDCEHCYFAW